MDPTHSERGSLRQIHAMKTTGLERLRSVRPQASPFGFPRRLVLLASICLLLASACELVLQRRVRAPELVFEGVRQLADDTFLYEFPSWSTDGKTIAVWRNTSNRGKFGPDDEGLGLALVDVSSGELKVISGIGATTYPTWSPDGNALAVMIYRPNEESEAVQGASN